LEKNFFLKSLRVPSKEVYRKDISPNWLKLPGNRGKKGHRYAKIPWK